MTAGEPTYSETNNRLSPAAPVRVRTDMPVAVPARANVSDTEGTRGILPPLPISSKNVSESKGRVSESNQDEMVMLVQSSDINPSSDSTHPAGSDHHEQNQPEKRPNAKKVVRGLYAFVKDYQRVKQQERGFVNKIAHGMLDPFLQYVHVTRLQQFVIKHSDAILHDALVKGVLDIRGKPQAGLMSQSIQSLAKAHGDVLSVSALADGQTLRPQQLQNARDIVTASIQVALNKEDNTAQMKLKALRESKSNIDSTILAIQQAAKDIFDLGKNAGITFQTPDSFVETVTDKIVFGGLSQEQSDIARTVAKRAHLSAALTAARFATAYFTGGQSLLVSIGANAAVFTGSRLATLYGQEAVFNFNSERHARVENATVVEPGPVLRAFARSRLARWMSVDWERQGSAGYRWQLWRAALAGAAVGVVARGAEHIDILGHAASAVQVPHIPEVQLPHGASHDVVIGGHHYEIPQDVQFNKANGDLFIMHNNKEIDIAHIGTHGELHDLNGYHITEIQQPGAPIGMHTYLHDQGAQHVDASHHEIYADQRQYEAYVSTDAHGNVNLTLPPTDNAIGIPQPDGSIEMLPFHPGDANVSVDAQGIMTVHLAPDNPLYQVLINQKEMHQFFLDKGGQGTMLDGVHNGATTTYVTGQFNGSTFVQHSTVNGSAVLPNHVSSIETVMHVTHPEVTPHVIEHNGDVYHTGAGAWLDQHVLGDDEAHFIDNTLYDIEKLNPNWMQVAGTAAAVAGGFVMGKGRTDRLFAGSQLGLGAGLALAPAYVIPGYPIGLAAGYLIGWMDRGPKNNNQATPSGGSQENQQGQGHGGRMPTDPLGERVPFTVNIPPDVENQSGDVQHQGGNGAGNQPSNTIQTNLQASVQVPATTQPGQVNRVERQESDRAAISGTQQEAIRTRTPDIQAPFSALENTAGAEVSESTELKKRLTDQAIYKLFYNIRKELTPSVLLDAIGHIIQNSENLQNNTGLIEAIEKLHEANPKPEEEKVTNGEKGTTIAHAMQDVLQYLPQPASQAELIKQYQALPESDQPEALSLLSVFIGGQALQIIKDISEEQSSGQDLLTQVIDRLEEEKLTDLTDEDYAALSQAIYKNIDEDSIANVKNVVANKLSAINTDSNVIPFGGIKVLGGNSYNDVMPSTGEDGDSTT